MPCSMTMRATLLMMAVAQALTRSTEQSILMGPFLDLLKGFARNLHKSLSRDIIQSLRASEVITAGV